MVVLSRLQVRMITPGTSEQEVPESVVPGVPGGTLGHTPESASPAGIARPKKQGPDAPDLGPYALCPPKTALGGSGKKKPQMKLGNSPL
jgi:hypothetical protein